MHYHGIFRWIGIFSLLLFVPSVMAEEWLACDIPLEPPKGYWVTHDAEPTEPPQWIDYRVITDKFTGVSGVALYNVENVADGVTFTAVAENEQGRRSDSSDPFVLTQRPSGPGPLKIILE